MTKKFRTRSSFISSIPSIASISSIPSNAPIAPKPQKCYTIDVKSLHRGIVILLLTLFLTNCKGQQTDTSSDEELLISGALTGAGWAELLSHGTVNLMRLRPSALLGIYVSDYLIHTSTYRAALAGVEAQMSLLFDDEYEKDESFEILENLGTILQIDVADMLNRSTSRSEAFDAYITSLAQLSEQAANHTQNLEQELEEILDERRIKRRETADIQRALNNALRTQDYASASGLQQQLIEAETEVAGVESREDEQNSLIRLFENLLDIADERMNAMRSNREALIAGVKVIEVPGVDDLGILEQGQRSRRRGSGFDRSLIDPSL